MESSGAVRVHLWPEIDRIVGCALDLPTPERADYIAAECFGRPEVEAEVASLVQASCAAGDFLEREAVAPEAPPTLQTRRPERVGAYRLLEEIGHGGMSVVYRAERDDGQFRKTAAVKLLATAWIGSDSLRRFLAERQILATLDHPNICRLLDGGVADGVPYLVMEYVDGAPILDYCRSHSLGERARLELLRQICAAVQYAHQHLIVHRDIKAGNVLVTREGQVKLMDFGIAKALAGSGPDQTQAGFGAMTPDYASPEQLQGGLVTTQSDVYSLGILAYELMFGERPYTTAGKSFDEIMTVAGNAKRPASSCAPELLAIIRHAMSKEPRDRYASAAALDEDVARYLAGEPVRAVTPSRWYRLRKWVGRHRMPVLGASAAALLILCATTFALWSAAEAREQRTVAEQRFRDVRRLANKVLFDYPFALRQLAASTDLQVRMATDSLQYLDDLSRSKGSDPDILMELARGYVQTGILLGTPRTGNLGQRDNARKSYMKAREILEDLLRTHPGMAAARRELANVLRRLSQLDSRNARQLAERGLALWEDLYRQQRRTEDLFNIGWAHVRLAELDLQSDHAHQAIESFQTVIASKPDAINAVHQEAYAQRLLARARLQRSDAPGALNASAQAKILDERARSLLGNSAAYAMEISLDLQLMAISHMKSGDIAPARALLEQSANIRRQAYRGNAGDEWIQQQYLDVLCWLGSVAEQQRDGTAARGVYDEAVKAAPALGSAQPTDEWNTVLGFAYGSKGLLLSRAGRRAEGCGLLMKSSGYFDRVRSFEFPMFQTRAAEVRQATVRCRP